MWPGRRGIVLVWEKTPELIVVCSFEEHTVRSTQNPKLQQHAQLSFGDVGESSTSFRTTVTILQPSNTVCLFLLPENHKNRPGQAIQDHIGVDPRSYKNSRVSRNRALSSFFKLSSYDNPGASKANDWTPIQLSECSTGN